MRRLRWHLEEPLLRWTRARPRTLRPLDLRLNSQVRYILLLPPSFGFCAFVQHSESLTGSVPLFSLDNLILPSSTYRSNRHSTLPREAEADNAGELLIPVAFDPSEEQRPPRDHDHASDGHSSVPSGHTSPHIAYQEKGRDRTAVDPGRWNQDELAATANGTARVPPGDVSKAPQIPSRTKSDSVRSSRSELRTGRGETSTFSSPSPESTRSSSTLQKDGSTFGSQRSTAADSSLTFPTRPSHELRRLHETSGSLDSSRSFLSSSSSHHLPRRGDSLESKMYQAPRRDAAGHSPRPPSVHSGETWHERSKTMTKIGESRTPRGDGGVDQSRPPRPNSITTIQQLDRTGSPLLRYSAGGDLSMDEDMARLMGPDDSHPAQTSDSFLRRVSNSVRHGRSFSDRGSRLSRYSKSPRSPANGTTFQGIASPSAVSPDTAGADEVAWLRSELRKERQRVHERELKIAEMESVLHATADVNQVNTELNEKRSTMVVLDARKEIVMRELSVLTDHLEAEKRGGSGHLDLGKLTNHVLREFVESIQQLKDSFTPQIEELVQSRNDTAEELANINRMKDKSFQEFEQLSSKNAQLAELNNQLVHQIQELYKATPTEGKGGANGLGIYSHGKEKSLSSIDALRSANDGASTANISEEAEPATIVPGPQVVSIRKGQPRKFNWKKGGQNVAKGVTKGIKGAFMSSENAVEGGPGLPRSQTQDPSRQGFGFFGNQRSRQHGGRIPQSDTVPVVAENGPAGKDYAQSTFPHGVVSN